ncbi:MAG: type I glyceraldehyde-3-phosphate dehydrogenase [Fidelibacterota bacterium]
MSNPISIGLFGFGRIGRNIFRLGYNDPRYEFTAISDLGGPESLHYLLMRDSVFGPIDHDIHLEGNYLCYNDHKTRLIPGGKPGTVTWDAFDIDLVIDATGAYRHKEDLDKHIEAGAKRLIVSVPPLDQIDRIVIPGINENSIQLEDYIISTTSSTTQVLALMLKILDEDFGVQRGMMTSIHAYTSDQPLADAVRSDLRRSRSAVENIIPNETWAPDYVSQIMPEFEDKISGIAFNVPVPDGSCVDLTTELRQIPSVEEANACVSAAANNRYQHLIGYTEDPIVSSDVIGREETMIFDAKATMIASGKMLKTLCWYDNGWGFAKRILEMADHYRELEIRS